jgi:hypothetical protein
MVDDYAGYWMAAREASIFGHSIQWTGPDHGDAVQQSAAEPAERANAPQTGESHPADKRSGHALGRSSRLPTVLLGSTKQSLLKTRKQST